MRPYRTAEAFCLRSSLTLVLKSVPVDSARYHLKVVRLVSGEIVHG